MLLYSSTGGDLEVKIITNNAAYVQKNDLAYLIHSDLPVPADILINTVGDGSFIVCDDNRYDFIEFKEKEAIIIVKLNITASKKLYVFFIFASNQ